MQNHNYTLILFEKDSESVPKQIGQKPIPKEQYEELINPLFKDFMEGNNRWHIEERRFFWRQDSVFVNFYIVIDGIRGLPA